MQFTTIIAVLSTAIMASAVPTNPPPTTSCSQGQVAACCDSVIGAIGGGCIQVPVLSTQCSQGQQLACCAAPTGVIAVGPVCNVVGPITV